jgi:hypothetical protein
MAVTKKVETVLDKVGIGLLDSWADKASQSGSAVTFDKVGDLVAFNIDPSRHSGANRDGIGAVKAVYVVGRGSGGVTLATVAIEGISASINAIAIRVVTETLGGDGSSVWRHSASFGRARAYPALGLKSTRGQVIDLDNVAGDVAGDIVRQSVSAIVAQVISDVASNQHAGAVSPKTIGQWNVSTLQARNLFDKATSELIRRAKGETVGLDLLKVLQGI